MCPDEVDGELESFYERIEAASIASDEVEKMPQRRQRGGSGNEKRNSTPTENHLPLVGYDVPEGTVDVEKVKTIMSRLHDLTLAELKHYLKEIRLSTRGGKKELRSRLRHFYRLEWAAIREAEQPESRRKRTEQHFDYLVCIDFECTCEEILKQYPHEIIEFPAVLIDVKKMAIIDKFRTYVKPVVRPELEPFCVNFTGIQQKWVDEAPEFREALVLFQQWMHKHRLGSEGARYAFVTDGKYDLWQFFQHQCELAGFDKPPHEFRYFIDIKATFEKVNKIQLRRYKMNQTLHVSGIEKMLAFYGLKPKGNAHCGIDDAINIARLTITMMHDVELRINSRYIHNKTMDQKALQKEIKAEEERLKFATYWRQIDIHKWHIRLPYRFRYVTKDEFLTGAYLDCPSCDEL